VSLLLDHGHPHASSYPIGLVWDEAQLVERRMNARLADELLLTQLAVASIFDKKAGETFNTTLKSLREVD
jgi:hypothetical protein